MRHPRAVSARVVLRLVRRARQALRRADAAVAVSGVLAAVLVVLSVYVAIVSLATPTDGLHVNRGTTMWGRGGGFEVTTGSVPGIGPGDVIDRIDGRRPAAWVSDLSWLGAVVPPPGRVVTYEVAPRDAGDAARTVRVRLERPSLSDFAPQWPAALYGLWQFGLGVLVFVLRPRAPAARAMLVGGAGVLLWMVGSAAGVSASDTVTRTGLLRWALSGIGFTLAWGGLLHFALLFPRTHPWLRGRERLAMAAYAVPLVLRVAVLSVTAPRADVHWERVQAWADVSVVEQWVMPLLVVAALVHHYVTGDRDTRARAGLIVLAAAEGMAGYVLLSLLPTATSGQSLVSTELQPLLVLPLPLAQTVALLRRRLLDIDVIVNQTIVWSVLTAGVVVAYVAGVWALGGLVSGTRPEWATLAVTALVAVAFQSGRVVVQRTVDRLMYGHRSEPYRVLAALSRDIGNTSAHTDVLPRAVRGIAEALRLPWVSVEVRDGQTIVWPRTRDPALPLWRCPLVNQGTLVGHLAVAARDSRRRRRSCGTTPTPPSWS